MIKTVVRYSNNMVMVFDKKGEQIPEYQGHFQEVKEKILKDAPQNTKFGYFPDDENKLKIVRREEW